MFKRQWGARVCIARNIFDELTFYLPSVCEALPRDSLPGAAA